MQSQFILLVNTNCKKLSPNPVIGKKHLWNLKKKKEKKKGGVYKALATSYIKCLTWL